MAVQQRYRSGKRPFRTYHKSSMRAHLANKTGLIVPVIYDDTDNDELTIFESWV